MSQTYQWNAGRWNTKPDVSVCVLPNLFSPSKNYLAAMQPDGNLVVYKQSDVVFDTKTTTFGARSNEIGTGPYCLSIQPDGNLVLRDSTGKGMWYANSYKRGKGPYKLNMQIDGNLVLYDSNSQAIWSSQKGLVLPNVPPYVEVNSPVVCADTNMLSPDYKYRASVQSDGNVVVYKQTAVWSTTTFGQGKGPFCLRLQPDGNLGVIDSTDKASWYSTSKNKGIGPYRLNMLDNGNLVIFDDNNRAIWSYQSGPIDVVVPMRSSSLNGLYYIKGGFASKYCSDSVGDSVICNRDSADTWEKFEIVDLGNNFYNIKGGRNIKFCSDFNGEKIACNKDVAGALEKFNIVQLSNGMYNIRGGFANKFCSDFEGKSVICNRDSADTWEQFHIIKVPTDIYPTIETSANRLYKAVVLPEGNVAVIDNKNIVKWKSKDTVVPAKDRVGPYTLKLKDNGDLVLVDSTDKTVWNTFTLGKGKGPNKLFMQDEGNLVLRDSTQKALWSSFFDTDYSDTCVVGVCSKPIVSPNQLIRAVMKDDGNLVVTDGKTTLWRPMVTTTSNVIGGYNPLTGGTAGGKVTLGPAGPTYVTTTTLAAFAGGTLNLQDNGELVIKNAAGTSVWSTGTSNKGVKPYKLVMQNDGNLVLYDSKDIPWWASKQGRIEHYYEETPCFPGGVRYRSVECKDDSNNNIVSNSLCSSQTEPSGKENCEYQSGAESTTTPDETSGTGTGAESTPTPDETSGTGTGTGTGDESTTKSSNTVWYIVGGVVVGVGIIILVIYLMKKKEVKSIS
jgi:hypothetical protein